MGFLANFSRVGLTVYNVFFFIYGLIVFGFFFVVKIAASAASIEIPTIKTLFWVTALVILLSSVVGCCVVQSQNPILIFIYAFLIFDCIILQVAIGTTIYKQSGDIATQAIKNQMAGFEKLPAETQSLFQTIQQENKCCGVTGAQDYSFNRKDSSTVSKVPDSCCHKYDDKQPAAGQIGHCHNTEELDKVPGCLVKITDSAPKQVNWKVIFVIGGIYFFFQILALIIAIALGSMVIMEKKENANRQNLMRQY